MSDTDRTEDVEAEDDDRAMWDLVYGGFGLLGVLAARSVGVFAQLAEQPRSINELCERARVPRRPMTVLLAACEGAGLVRCEGDDYALTTRGARHLLAESPADFGGVFDAMEATFALFTPERLVGVVRADAPAGYGQGEMFKSHAEQVALARGFTRAMHGLSATAAAAWPDAIDLEGARTMLDIAGGSGIHSVGATARWPELRAVVLEMPTVCDVTREYVARFGAADRVSVAPGDMWKDPYPQADTHFYSMVFHDWPLERCEVLARKSFESLPPGGRILVHEMLLAPDRSGPATVASLGVSMLFGTQGQQYTARELTGVLERAGFCDVAVKSTSGYWSMISGLKPSR